MSDEALRLFLYGPARESFLGAKSTPNANDKYPKRQLDTDDAVALLPVLHGVFRLNRSSVVPLQKPLLGLQLPEVSATGRWNVRAKHSIAVVLKHLATLDINFHSSTKKYGTKVPFAEVLKNINEVETELANSLEKHKAILVANAAAARKSILLEIVGQVQGSLGREALQEGKIGDAALAIELTNMLQSTWDASSKNYTELPFEHKSKYATDKAWSDFVNLSGFWQRDFKVKGIFTDYEKAAATQETYQIDAAIASIRLGVLLYKKLIAVLEADTFASELMRKYYAYQLSASDTKDPRLDRISDKEHEAWERYVHTYFKDLLIERLELLQANLYSFNVMTIGKGERATNLADSLTVTLVRSVTAPLFDFTLAQPYYRKDTQKQKEAKDISEAEIARGKQYDVHVKRIAEFFKAFTPTALTKEDTDHVESSTAALFEPHPTVRVKSVHLRDLTYPTIERKFTEVMGKRSIAEHPKITGKNVAKLSVSLAVSPENEVLQPFKNIIIELIDGSTNLVSKVTKHIVHAVGLADSAFVATYYANNSDSDLAAYHALFPTLLSAEGAAAATTTNPSAVLAKPAWISAIKVETADLAAAKGSLNVAGIDSLFVFKNNPSAALTHPARPPSAKSGNKDKKANAASDNKPKGNQPKKGGKAGDSKKGGQKDTPKGQKSNKGGNKANTNNKGGKQNKK